MLNAKLTDNFHSMRLVLTNSNGDALTLHVGASVRVASRQMKRSPAGLRSMNQLAEALFNFIVRKDGMTYGQKMSAIQTLAQQCVNFDALTVSLRSA